MTNISVTKPYQKRRRYSKELKARIVAECLKPMELPPYARKARKFGLYLTDKEYDSRQVSG